MTATRSVTKTPSGVWRFSRGLRPRVRRVPPLPRGWGRPLGDLAWEMRGPWPDGPWASEDWKRVLKGEDVVLDWIAVRREGDQVRLDALYVEQWGLSGTSVVVPLDVLCDMLGAYRAWVGAGNVAEPTSSGLWVAMKTTPSPKATPSGTWSFSEGPTPGVRRDPPLPRGWVAPLGDLAWELWGFGPRHRGLFFQDWDKVLAGEDVVLEHIAAERDGDQVRLEALDEDQWLVGREVLIPLTVLQDMLDAYQVWLEVAEAPEAARA